MAAFPDLVAKLRLDTSDTTKGLADATKGVEEFTTKSLERVNLLSEAIKHLSENTKKIGEAAAGAATGGGGVFGALGSIGGSIPFIGAAVAGVTGLLGGLEHLVNTESEFAFSIMTQNALLGVNTNLLQTLDATTEKYGGSQEDVTTGLRKLQVNLDAGGTSLNRYHLSLKDVGITSSDLNVAVPQLADYLASNASAADKTAVSTALLGKGQTALTEALSHGTEGLNAQQAALVKNGVLMDAQTLQAGALTHVMRDEMGEALKGLEVQLVGPLFSGFSALFQLIQGGAQNSQGAFHGIGEALNSVVSGITSFLSGLFGITLDPAAAFEDYKNQLIATATKTRDQAVSTRDAAQAQADQKTAVDDLAAATKEQTQAIDAQVKSLQRQQQVYDNNIDAQIAGQRQLVSALDQQLQMQDLLQKQADDNGTSALAQLKAQLKSVQDTYTSQRKAGESEVDFEKRLKEQGLQDQITAEETKRAQQKDSTDIQKAQLSDATNAVIANLQAQKTAYDNDTRNRVNALNDQKTALQQHLQDQQAAYQQSIAKGKDDLATYNANVRDAQTQLDAATALTPDKFPMTINPALVNAGAQVRATFQNWIQHPDQILPDMESVGIQFATSLVQGIIDYMTGVGGLKIGKSIVDSLAGLSNPFSMIPGVGDFFKGIETAVPDRIFDRLIQNAESNLPKSFVLAGPSSLSAAPSPANQTRQFGGSVLAGMDYLVGEQGPERFRAPASGTITPAAQSSGGGDRHFTFNIQGAPQMSADELMREAAWHLKVA